MLHLLLFRRHRRVPRWATAGSLAALGGCASMVATEVSPGEIPAIEARLGEYPDDGAALHRYAAALLSADRCSEVGEAASRAMQAAPDIYLGPLALGRCLELEDRRDEAIELYTRFLVENEGGDGSAAIEAQRRLAVADRAAAVARLALESDLPGAAAATAEPNTVAILPALVVGDPRYEALSRGIAAMMISDLDLLERFRLVERIEVEAILDEWALAQSDRADPATIARLGRVTRAGRAVQGTVTLDPTNEAALLEAVVSSETDPAIEVAPGSGVLPSIIELEKDLVLEVSSALGYEPSTAERVRILENGTRNLAAFLAFSEGLDATAQGDFQGAIDLFEEALTLDSDFEQARTELANTMTLQLMTNASVASLPTVGMAADDAMLMASMAGGASVGAAIETSLAGSVLDVGGLDGERITLSAGEPGAEQETGRFADGVSGGGGAGAFPQTVPGTIRIILGIP